MAEDTSNHVDASKDMLGPDDQDLFQDSFNLDIEQVSVHLFWREKSGSLKICGSSDPNPRDKILTINGKKKLLYSKLKSELLKKAVFRIRIILMRIRIRGSASVMMDPDPDSDTDPDPDPDPR